MYLCMFWILQYARCGMMPDMSRDAELHSCWAVNHDPYHPVLLSQHDKPLGIHCKISEEKNTRPAKSCKACSSHFFNIYSLNNIFLKSKSWYYAKMEVDLIRGEKEILLLSTFAFIRKQVVVRSMEHLFELWYESPEAATTRKKHTHRVDKAMADFSSTLLSSNAVVKWYDSTRQGTIMM